jgi:hypothetical protein
VDLSPFDPDRPEQADLPAGQFLVSRDESRLRRMRRAILSASKLMQDQHTMQRLRFRAAMVTLTYREDAEWAPRHIADYTKAVREWARRQGYRLRYVWVLELTKRGRPHYHCLFWLPRGVSMPKADKRGWWPHGHTRTEWARNPVGYLAKYASKGCDSHQLPSGARVYGVGGLDEPARMARRWWMAPGWVRRAWSWRDNVAPRLATYTERNGQRVIAEPGGGWVSRETGELIPSPWRLGRHGTGWRWVVVVWDETCGPDGRARDSAPAPLLSVTPGPCSSIFPRLAEVFA